jgi:2-polyprenyl-6-methoxyphenol hydroxylase-like FAD-dependent oxidoreductase
MLRSSVVSSGFRRCFSNATQNNFDLIVVGGGIVGVASAREVLIRHPHLKIAIVEKENKLAYHQSGHNRLRSIFICIEMQQDLCQ